ncbi:MAG: lysophospholipid acyltransferase family protein [Verrucomicrobiales bacterium]
MKPWPKVLFYVLVVRPIVLIIMGLNVRHRERLPEGAAILVVNHNSHLDTLAVASIVPMRNLARLRPVGARDYFCRNPFCEMLSRNMLGVIPLDRRPKRGEDLFGECVTALNNGELLVIFPEGTRGEPEERAPFKAGIGRLVERCPDTPMVPVFLRGCGKSLPRGEALFVPFVCEAVVGEALAFAGDRKAVARQLEVAMDALEETLPATVDGDSV